MTHLIKRRTKVERLTNQALKDAQPHKYIQGMFLIKEINHRLNNTELQRINYLNSLRQ